MADKPTTPEVRASYSKHEKNQLPDVSFFRSVFRIKECTIATTKKCLGGGNSNIFFMFNPKIGEDEPILTNIFQRG